MPLSAQNDSVSVPEFEYGMTRKTYEIADIAVEGADSYEDFVLIGFSGLAVGDKIEVPGDQITKAIKRFWKQGLFSNVKIKASKIEGNKIWLVIELEQRPRVSEIRYEGMKKSEREDVEVKAGIRQGSQMTPNLEDHAKTVIKKYFAEKGFHNTEVHVVQRNDPDHPGYVRVLIAVDKKAKTKVGKIYITGNEALTDLQINKAMKKTNDNNIINLFRTKKFVTEEYEKDKQAVIEKYNEYGYRDAYIVADSVVPNPEDPTRVDVYMTISEGDKYYVRSVKWVGNTVYPYELLDATLGVKPGDVYNLKTLNDRLTNDDDAVSKLYTDRGYLFFNVEPVEVNVENAVFDTIAIEGLKVLPLQPSLPKSDRKEHPLFVDDDAYAADVFWGQSLASVQNLGVGRDRNYATLSFSPVSVNPVSGQMVVCRSADVTVSYRNADVVCIKFWL